MFNTKISKFLTAIAVVACTSNIAHAVEKTYPEIDTAVAKLGLQVQDIVDVPLEGMKGVLTDKGLFYVSEDGTMLLHGTLFNLKEGMRNESEAILSKVRISQLGKFKGDLIEYKAKNEKYAINVFTDITCGYCRKLHQQIEEYNDLGITVRYLAFPRGGVASQSYRDMVSVWCAKDPAQAMNDAKLKGQVAAKSCSNPVVDHYNFGAQIGVSGTPAIILEDGTLVPGYRPPQDMLQVLQGS
ncbi:disulfide bond isomerase, DsbC/G-like protein [Catenovulum agarivorans DS-2]|uniref:Thiol:disulfide interchange protein n=1 Tax=Catenovulum agarivorans DS-2 TaxID=1328313 RepID=W7QIV5_9ALTE|nr:bifunctional protein-disulfide isomerase/oxidoreductase DsbC [Catenovulum agarivorans]EWH08872.1 disulfide bond isomerase, DsbC/G-like protein [Catenovulum agarivorans DS-2]